MPNVDVMKIGNEIALPELYIRCIESVCDVTRILKVAYPARLSRRRASDAEWADHANAVFELNSALLDALKDTANCYAIYTKGKHEDWTMRFLGQSDARKTDVKLMRHIAPQSGRVDTVFIKCREAVRDGFEIGIRPIRVEPETLRHFVVEKAINELRGENLLDWNRGR